MTLNSGAILHNRYRIDKLITQGGFGTLYKVWDTTLGRACALKENLDNSPATQRQFLQEAKILANLAHTNLPRVTDYFTIPGQGQYLIMDYVEGNDIQEICEGLVPGTLHGGRITETQALLWINQICEALSYLHSQNPPIIHRDIKPANIRITPGGRAMLVDFGIAKVYDPKSKTTVGAQAITPGFSPYEQYGKGRTDARTDVYALGATLYTMATGIEPPESVQRVVNDPLVPPRQLNPSLSHRTSAAILRALQMDPAKRFQSAEDFKAALKPPSIDPLPAPPLPTQAGQTPQPALRPAASWNWINAAAILISIATILLVMKLIKTGPGGDTASQIPVGIFSTSSPFAPSIATGSIETKTTTPTATTLPTPLPALSPTPALPLVTLVSEWDGMILVSIPEGEFWMGSTDSEREAVDDEKPQHLVHLDTYWIDQIEVNNGRYNLCVRAGACRPPEQNGSRTRMAYFNSRGYDEYPVIYVSWEDADTYCRWVKRRLPSEAEWEKAARGMNGFTYPWGDDLPNSRLANYNNQVGDTSPVGFYPDGASPYGVLDMAGNVAEWVEDWHDAYYYLQSPSLNPLGPGMGEFRVIRGGSWFNMAGAIRAAFRLWNYPDIRSESIGFRCARSQ
jgi:formylglycine-generating enzyme required for sulfatase activity/tRNA A-37 threonylcarbamoyl transferase component Bud32